MSNWNPGGTISAIDLQREYLDLAQKVLKGRDDDTDWVLTEWESVLDDLETDPELLIDRVDWVTKKWLLEAFMEEEGLEWTDPWIESLDLEYHHLNSEKGLYYELEREGHVRRVTTDEQIEAAIRNAPENTRAKARSHVMRYLAQHRLPCIIDWNQIYFSHEEPFEMKDPFDTYDAEVEDLLKRFKRTTPPRFTADTHSVKTRVRQGFKKT